MKALISVSDKTGVLQFAQGLYALGVQLLSTGGTAKLLAEAGLPVTEVAEHTGFPEMLDGRVKTLHPKVHGGLLARSDLPAHVAAMEQHGIERIDLLVVNLYPFKQTIEKPNVTLAEAIENIDIGGPAMIRAAAKNFKFVTVVTNPSRYDEIAASVAKDGCVHGMLRMQLAQEAFAHTAKYDDCIQNYLQEQINK